MKIGVKSLLSVTKLVKLAALASGVLLCQSASASQVVQATITALRASEHNVFFVFVNQTPVNPKAPKPACVAAQPAGTGVYALDVSTAGGKALKEMLLLAKATNKRVTIVGRGDWPDTFTGVGAMCNLWSDVETANYIEIRD